MWLQQAKATVAVLGSVFPHWHMIWFTETLKTQERKWGETEAKEEERRIWRQGWGGGITQRIVRMSRYAPLNMTELLAATPPQSIYSHYPKTERRRRKHGRKVSTSFFKFTFSSKSVWIQKRPLLDKRIAAAKWAHVKFKVENERNVTSNREVIHRQYTPGAVTYFDRQHTHTKNSTFHILWWNIHRLFDVSDLFGQQTLSKHSIYVSVSLTL